MGCGAQGSANQINSSISIPQALPKYQRKQLIGKGTYGSVYKCADTLTNQFYAMKVIKISHTSKQQVKKQVNELKSEISMLKKLNHQYIVKYHNFDVTPNLDEVQIVMELVVSGTLKEYIEKKGPLSQSLCSQIGQKILKALVYLHDQCIIHRDIKCANVLINQKMEPKISDFGTAKVASNLEKDDIARMSASLKGTPYYMAPQVVKRTGHNQSADIWSFGCMMIEMLSGKAPWTILGAKFSEIVGYISSGVRPPFPTKISKECQNFLESCLDPVASNRLKAHELLKHKFINKNGGILSNYSSNKKDRIRRDSEAKTRGSTNDLLTYGGTENRKIDSDQKSIRSQAKTHTSRNTSQMSNLKQESSSNLTKVNKNMTTPSKNGTQKYLNQLNHLDMLEAEMEEVEVEQDQFQKQYFVKKTLTNLKENKHGKNISKTSASIKQSEELLLNMSASQGLDMQLRTIKQDPKYQQIINTSVSRAERNQYIQQQQILQRQKENERKKWEEELKQGAQFMKKAYSNRYMYTYNHRE